MEKQLHFPRGTIINTHYNGGQITIYDNYLREDGWLVWSERGLSKAGDYARELSNVKVIRLGQVDLATIEIF